MSTWSRVFVSDPTPTHLRPAEAPSAQIGRRQDLEMETRSPPHSTLDRRGLGEESFSKRGRAEE